MPSSLDHIRVLDLSRILAGPVATQLLGDLGAEIIKVERPGAGDDTRAWGPPFLQDESGADTATGSYYLSANRNKKSVTIDISTPRGQALIHALAATCDVLIHNFKVGGLEAYGLGYDEMRVRHPRLIYAAITGFGQTGPMKDEPGYDLLAQAQCGLMGHTGDPGAPPMKAGVALIDVITGLYAANGIQAALSAREKTGEGQMIDLSLLDCGLAAMTNIAQFYLTSGAAPARHGNAHATIVPYQAFAAADAWIVVAVGNDAQFGRFCAVLDRPEWAEDIRFSTNAARVIHRAVLVPMIEGILMTKPAAAWLASMKAAGLPAAPVNDIESALTMPQALSRGMCATVGGIDLVGNPLNLSATPVSYDLPPPSLGAHTEEVLKRLLGLSNDDISSLRNEAVI